MIRSLLVLLVLAGASSAATAHATAASAASSFAIQRELFVSWGSLVRALFRGGTRATQVTVRSSAMLSYEQRLLHGTLESGALSSAASRQAHYQRLRAADPYFTGADEVLLQKRLLTRIPVSGVGGGEMQGLRLHGLGMSSAGERNAIRHAVQAEAEKEIIILDAYGRPAAPSAKALVPESQRADLHRILDEVLDSTPRGELKNSLELQASLGQALKKRGGTWTVSLREGDISRSFVHRGVTYTWKVPVYKVLKKGALAGGGYLLGRDLLDTTASRTPVRVGVGMVGYKKVR